MQFILGCLGDKILKSYWLKDELDHLKQWQNSYWCVLIQRVCRVLTGLCLAFNQLNWHI